MWLGVQPRRVVVFLTVVCVFAGIGVVAVNSSVADTATVPSIEDRSEINSPNSGDVDIVDESPERDEVLYAGDTVTFDLDVAYDTGGEAPDRLSVRITENGFGGEKPVKEVDLSGTSGTESITVTEDIDVSWETAGVVVNLWGEETFGSLATDEIIYGVGDNQPNALSDCTATEVSEGETFDCGSQSVAPGGDIVSHDWTTPGMEIVLDNNDFIQLEAQDPGDHTIELIITDEDGRTDTAEETVSVVEAPNEPPESSADSPPSPVTVDENDELTFRVDAEDPDGELSGVDWYIDGTFQETTTGISGSWGTDSWTHQFDEPGTVDITAEVFDQAGIYNTDAVMWTVTVEEDIPEEPPEAVLDCDYPVAVGESLSCDGSSSFHPDGTIESFEWEFEEQPIASGPSTSVSYDTAGTYSVTLTVTGSEGLTDTTSEMIEVRTPPEIIPTMTDNTPVEEGEEIELELSVTNSGEMSGSQQLEISPVDSFAFSSQWVDIDLSGGASTTETITYDTSRGDAGEYTFEVSGEEGSDSTSVTVFEPASLEVDVSTDRNIVAGQTFDIVVDIENVGGAEATQSIEIIPETAAPIDSHTDSVTLEPGEEDTRVVTFEPAVEADGSYDIDVLTDDDVTTISVFVEEPERPNFELDSTIPETVEPGEEYTFPVTVNNPDNLEADVTLLVDGTLVSTERVTDSSALRFDHEFRPGARLLELELEDEIGLVERETWPIETEGVAPSIPSYGPSNTQQSVSTGETLTFSVDPVDPFNQDVDITWAVDGVQVTRGDEEFQRVFDSDGTYEITATVTNEDGLSTTQSWTVQVDAFLESPRIADHSTADRIVPDDETQLVTFSFWHPEINDRTAIVEIRAETPDGFAISGGQGVDDLDQAQSIAISEVGPGERTNIAVDIGVIDDSLVGTSSTFDYEILYYPQDEADEAIVFNKSVVTLTVDDPGASDDSTDPVDHDSQQESDEHDGDETEANDDSFGPGFGVWSAVVSLAALIYVLKYMVIKKDS